MSESRRVVAGVAQDGQSVVLSDDDLGPVPDSSPQTIWRAEDWPTIPNDGSTPDSTVFPSDQGIWIVKWSLAGMSTAGTSANSGQSVLPMPEDDSGFHDTQTVDINVVLSGELTVEFDNKETRTLRAGDIIVMNGNTHAWHNRQSERCVIQTTIVGAKKA